MHSCHCQEKERSSSSQHLASLVVIKSKDRSKIVVHRMSIVSQTQPFTCDDNVKNVSPSDLWQSIGVADMAFAISKW